MSKKIQGLWIGYAVPNASWLLLWHDADLSFHITKREAIEERNRLLDRKHDSEPYAASEEGWTR